MASGPELGEITPEFLTECLREAGYAQASVSEISGERIGTGQIGQCIRYALKFSG